MSTATDDHSTVLALKHQRNSLWQQARTQNWAGNLEACVCLQDAAAHISLAMDAVLRHEVDTQIAAEAVREPGESWV